VGGEGKKTAMRRTVRLTADVENIAPGKVENVIHC
jgi:hypothetical protein